MTSRRDFLKGLLSTIGGVAIVKPKIDFAQEEEPEETEEKRHTTKQKDLPQWEHTGFYGSASSCAVYTHWAAPEDLPGGSYGE